LYAFLAFLDPRARTALRYVWQIRLTVIQPFGYPMPPDGPVRTRALNRRQILDFGWAFYETIRAATDRHADLPLIAGDHCRWCAAKPVCAEHAREQVVQRHNSLETDFAIVDLAEADTLFSNVN